MEWVDFIDFVHKLLEEHPIPRVGNLMALRLGSSTYTHYSSWKVEAINIAKTSNEKIFYLLTHWREKMKPSSLKALVMKLDEKLSKDATFNSIREKISQRFL